MQFTKFTEDVSNITTLPNQITCKASDLKKAFDKGSLDIKDFINNILIPELTALSEEKDNEKAEIYSVIATKLTKISGKTSEIINDGNGTSPFATTEEVAQAIANLVDSSPDALDTLKELADALGNDPDFATTVLNLIATKLDKTTYEEDKENLESDILNLENNKVDKIDGKGLSEEDYTKEEKTKLKNLPTLTELNEELDGIKNTLYKKEDKLEFDEYKKSTNNALSSKIDKEEGKGLSQEDYTKEEKQKLSQLPSNEELQDKLNEKMNTTGFQNYVDTKVAKAVDNPIFFSTQKVENLYDNDNPTIIDGYCSSAQFYTSNSHKTLQIPCLPNTIYCISRSSLVGRLNVVGFSQPLADGVKADMECYHSTVKVPYKDGEYLLIETSENTKYIGIYYFNISDGLDEAEIRKNIRVDLGMFPSCGYKYEFTKDVDTSEFTHLKCIDDMEIKLGNELITSEPLTISGFSGTRESGFTYDGTTKDAYIEFYSGKIDSGNYILEFDTSYTGGESVRVRFATGYKQYTYNGGKHIIVALPNTEGHQTLYFHQIYTGAFTISNVSLKKITDYGTPYTLKGVNVVSTKNNPKNYGFWNILLGYNTADDAVGSTRTVAIGNNALGSLKGGHRNIGIGTFAMSQMTGGESNISIGADSMLAVKNAEDCVAIGKSTMYNGTKLINNVAVGAYALSGSNDSTAQYNVVVGNNAGIATKGNGNTFLGHQAGYRNTTGIYNTLVGFNTLGRSTGSYNVCLGYTAEYADGCNNTIVIGNGAKSTKSNQVVIGNANSSEIVLGNKKINFNEDGTVTWEAI